MSNFIGLEVPTGSIMPCVDFNFSNLGHAWLLCNGSQVSNTTYPDLYTVIGSTYNTGGESSGNFRLPNLVDRIPLCEAGNNVGTYGGSNNYSLGTSNMPSHSHSFSQSSHQHFFSNIYGDDFNNVGGEGGYYKKIVLGANDGANNTYNPTSGHTDGVSKNSGYTGSSTAFNAVPVSKKVLYIIKT
jgi:microcystin-dependent protein